MEKYEWLWKTMKQHKQELVDKFEAKGKQGSVGHLQHKSALDVMEYLEIREKDVNKPTKHADISINELREMAEL